MSTEIGVLRLGLDHDHRGRVGFDRKFELLPDFVSGVRVHAARSRTTAGVLGPDSSPFPAAPGVSQAFLREIPGGAQRPLPGRSGPGAGTVDRAAVEPVRALGYHAGHDANERRWR
jgi:hypothetical protein